MRDRWLPILRGRALGRAAALLGVLSVFLVWFSFQDNSPLVKTERSSVTVLDVRDKGWNVRLEDGKSVWIFSSPGIAPKPGDRIPVRIETYESGDRYVVFDRESWAAGG